MFQFNSIQYFNSRCSAHAVFVFCGQGCVIKTRVRFVSPFLIGIFCVAMPGPHLQLDGATVTRIISELESPVTLTNLVCNLCKIHRYKMKAGQTMQMHSVVASLLEALRQPNILWQSATPEVEQLLGDAKGSSMLPGDLHKFIQRCVLLYSLIKPPYREQTCRVCCILGTTKALFVTSTTKEQCSRWSSPRLVYHRSLPPFPSVVVLLVGIQRTTPPS